MKRRKLQIADLHLWEVRLSDGGATLWITTPTKSLARALDKSEKHVARYYEDYEIMKIEYHGTLDA